MVIEVISTSFGSTGSGTILLNNITGVPKGVIWLTGGASSNETANGRIGTGANDGTNGIGIAELVNNSGKFSRQNVNGSEFQVLDGASGNPIVDGYTTGFSTGQISVQINHANASYPIKGVAFADS